MASGPITSWQIEGGKVEVVTDFLLLVSKITVECDCNHEIQRHFLLGRKAMTNIGSVLKSWDSTCQQSPYSQNYGFFQMYGCGSETIRWLCTKYLMLLSCGAVQGPWESLGLQGDPTSPS